MAILLALLGAIAAVAVLLWRLHIASAVARDAIEVADDARSFLRRLGWSRKARRHPLDLVEDPREAAAAINKLLDQSKQFAVLTSPEARPYVRMILERLFPSLPVLSHVEIARGVEVNVIGSVA